MKKNQNVSRRSGSPSADTELNYNDLAEGQKAHQEHLQRLKAFKKKRKQQIVGLIIEGVLLLIVIAAYVGVNWASGIFGRITVPRNQTNPAQPSTNYSSLPTHPMVSTGDPQGSGTDPSGETGTTLPSAETLSTEPYTNPDPNRVPEIQKGFHTFVLFGVDARETSSLLHSTQGDVCIIITINKESGEVRMASVFRDFYFESDNGKYEKLTDTYNFQGAEHVMAALNRNLDLSISHYVAVNWKTVADIVDILGGLDVDMTLNEATELRKYVYETRLATGRESVKSIEPKAGVQHLDGVHTVCYSRIRYNTGADFARTERQRKVIGLILDKIKENTSILKFNLIRQIVETVSENMRTTLTPGEILALASQAQKYQIVATGSFPVHRGFAGEKICSTDYVLDVTELHSYLYGNNEYVPSDNIRRVAAYHDTVLKTKQDLE